MFFDNDKVVSRVGGAKLLHFSDIQLLHLPVFLPRTVFINVSQA